MRAVPLSGGAGFIGSCLIRRWLDAEDSEVVVWDILAHAGQRGWLAKHANGRHRQPRLVSCQRGL